MNKKCNKASGCMECCVLFRVAWEQEVGKNWCRYDKTVFKLGNYSIVALKEVDLG